MDLIKFLLLHQLLLVFFFNWLLIGFIVLNCLLHRSHGQRCGDGNGDGDGDTFRGYGMQYLQAEFPALCVHIDNIAMAQLNRHFWLPAQRTATRTRNTDAKRVTRVTGNG